MNYKDPVTVLVTQYYDPVQGVVLQRGSDPNNPFDPDNIVAKG